MNLEQALAQVTPLDETAMENANRVWQNMAKPLGSLGVFEDYMVQLAGIFKTEKINIDKKCVVIMCADNGVVAQKISQTTAEITTVVAKAFTLGDSTVCKFAQCTGTDVIPVDIGMLEDVSIPGLIDHKIANGTKDFAVEPAMTKEQAIASIEIGINMVGELKEKGYNIIATGEMGIGNSTTSSACASALLTLPPALVTGRGAGLTTEMLAHKIDVIAQAICLHKPNGDDGLEVLTKLGGFDIGGMIGLYIGGAVHRIPVVIDGLISSVAALIAVNLCPLSIHYMIASHLTHEPAGKAIMEKLGLHPVLDGHMRLGEGTGAVMCFPLLDMVVHTYNNMKTFEGFQMEAYQPLK